MDKTAIPEILQQVSGNISDKIKVRALVQLGIIRDGSARQQLNTFGKAIGLKLKLTELSVVNKAEEPNKLEGRAVLEIDVDEDMVNEFGSIHGGCTAYLIDHTSVVAVAILDIRALGNISQALNIVYHSPAIVGDRLRLVNTTLTVGSRVESARTEIWNITNHRLVASAVHVRMSPSKPSKLKAAL